MCQIAKDNFYVGWLFGCDVVVDIDELHRIKYGFRDVDSEDCQNFTRWQSLEKQRA
jgi:hypothetical protein